ncbi:abortive infection family protein [Sporosarcina sp. ACRSM]|uniref:abortive infection family protein n=1 Tax=Sporosarcina sp. ACRSM TaxID=2918216 RepID=UPI001EF46E23|nr:abortive infection family protein [Sporosarcina sp. ACRSM]MCG7337066.1 abortive infection family protein [Sporosarcina sp. ACRSM]
MNETVKLLDRVKSCLIDTYNQYHEFGYKSTDFDFNGNLSDRDYLEARLIMRKLSKDKGIELPDFFESTRNVKEFINEINSESGYDYNNNSGYIAGVFNRFSTYLEDNLYEVEIVEIECHVPKELSFQNILRDLENCDLRMKGGDYAGAITSAKTLVEGVCKELIETLEIDFNSNNSKLPQLFNTLSQNLNLDASNPKYDKSLKEIITGLYKIVNGLSTVRNEGGDSHARLTNPSFHHAALTVNAAKTIVSFLFQTYEYQSEKGLLQSNG